MVHQRTPPPALRLPRHRLPPRCYRLDLLPRRRCRRRRTRWRSRTLHLQVGLLRLLSLLPLLCIVSTLPSSLLSIRVSILMPDCHELCSAHLIFHTGRNEFPSPTGRTHGAFLGTALLLSFIWTIYLIIWPFTDGGNVISPTGEVVWYGIVDLLAGPVFLAFFLWTHRDVELGYTAANGAAANRDVKA